MSQIKRVWRLVNEGYSEEDAYAIIGEEIKYNQSLDTKISNIISDSFMSIEELQKQLNNYKYISSNITEKEIIEEVFNNSKYHYLSNLIISVENKDYNHLNQVLYHITYFLRNEGLKSSTIYYLVFYIFFFKKLSDELDSKPLSNIEKSNFDFLLLEALLEIEVSYKLEFNLSEELLRMISNIPSDTIYEVFYILNSLNSTLYESNIFAKYLVSFMKKTISDTGSKYYSNHSLHRLMVKILNIKNHSEIFDPFGGLAELLIESLYQKDSTAYYMDINREIGLMAYMSFIMFNHNKINVSIQNSLDSYEDKKLYDYVLSEPPFGLRVSPHQYNDILDMVQKEGFYQTKIKNDSTPYFLIFILSKLKENGKAIILVSSSFVSNLSTRELREYLIENDLIEAIIDLPSNILLNTGIRTSLLFLNKNKSNTKKKKIKFINAELLIKQTKREEAILDVEGAVNAYLSENKNSIVIDSELIIKNEYQLNSNMYRQEFIDLQNLIKDEKAKYIKDLVEIQMGKHVGKDINYSKSIGIPFIKIKDLKKDILDIQLLEKDDFDRVNKSELQSTIKIDKECILIARLINQLKPTIFKPTKDMPYIYVDQNVYALTIKKDIISIEYLYYQLYTKLLVNQIEAYAVNSSYAMLNRKQLENLIIPYVPIVRQEEYIEIQKSSIITQEKSQLESKLKLLGYEQEIKQKESDIVRVLVHQLRATLLTMSMQTQNLQEIIEINNIENFTNYIDDDIDNSFDTPKKFTLKEISDKLYADSIKLNESLTNVKKVMDFKLNKSDFKSNNICTFFKEYIDKKKIEVEDKYEIILKCSDINIDFNKSSFTELLDQLLLNAEKHAFIDNQKYKLMFDIKANKKRNILTINYINNGKKFNISKEEYIGAFVKGQSSQGSGIGGNYIYRIIQAHKGDLFITEEEKGFHLKIEIPLNQKGE